MGYMVRMMGAMPAAVRVAPIAMLSLFPTGGIESEWLVVRCDRSFVGKAISSSG
jgi:hypothetical protein